MLINNIKARIIKDSRNEKTIEVSVNGSIASSPNGKSKGKYESEPYKNNLDWCVQFLNNWDIPMTFYEFEDLIGVEDEIKRKIGKNDVKKFGGNALFALECAILKALAKEEKEELWQVINPVARKIPKPVGNVVGGGKHSEEFINSPDIQEFLVLPNAKTIKDNINIMNEFYEFIREELDSKEKNDENAWVTNKNEQEIIDTMNFVKSKLQKKYNVQIGIGIDVAASSIYGEDYYESTNKGRMNRNKQIHFIKKLIEENELFYVEDPLQEEDFSGFYKISKGGYKNCLIVGDDLTATQIGRVEKASRMNSINAMIIKPNQNGSLFELKKIFEMCKRYGIKTIMSHRSGETTDDALADLAVGFGADYIKTGVNGKERESKLNRLKEIEDKIKLYQERKKQL